ncbi:hypothetical protein ACWDBW_10380 [Streptomyces sp. NPDC001107]
MICHTWRNYLALGSLGPDLFYLLPDFADTKGCLIRQVVEWVREVWEETTRHSSPPSSRVACPNNSHRSWTS